MRRLFILVIVVLISFSPLGGFLASGQEQESAYWNGVSAPEAVEDPVPLEEFLVGVPLGDQGISRERSIGTRLPRGYRIDFRFDPNATDFRPQVPEIEDAEFMVVIVESGSFVLNILPESPAFVVDPPEGTTISYMKVSGEWGDPPAPGFTYEESDEVVLDENGEPCTDLCTVQPPPPGVPPSADNAVAVLLEEGFRVEALGGNFCLWCLIKGDEGSLLVYPYTKDGREFSWVRSYNASRRQESPEGLEYLQVQGDPVSTDSAPVRMAWAYNPGSGCK
jgi:hypothetical protein